MIKPLKTYRSLRLIELMTPLFEFLNEEYPMEQSTVSVDFAPAYAAWVCQGKTITGYVRAVGMNAIINVATKERSPREVALTVAHEFMHCIQFIQRDLCMNEENKEALENEAITFAEDVLKTLWETQKVFYPSTL